MNRKKVTVILLIGILSGIFILVPILNFLGIPTFQGFLTIVFGEGNPWTVVVAIIVICLVTFGLYRRPKKGFNMCRECYIVSELFNAAESHPHQNYLPTLAFIHEMLKQERIELFAGDCPLEEVDKHLSDELHYTIKHCFRCKSCKLYFLIGACIRGMPIYEIKENIETVNFDNILWGRFGTLYKQNSR